MTSVSPGKEEVKAAKDTTATINNAAAAVAGMGAHGEADAHGEVEGEGEAEMEMEIEGVEEWMAKIGLNSKMPSRFPPVVFYTPKVSRVLSLRLQISLRYLFF